MLKRNRILKNLLFLVGERKISSGLDMVSFSRIQVHVAKRPLNTQGTLRVRRCRKAGRCVPNPSSVLASVLSPFAVRLQRALHSWQQTGKNSSGGTVQSARLRETVGTEPRGTPVYERGAEKGVPLGRGSQRGRGKLGRGVGGGGQRPGPRRRGFALAS